MKNSNHDIAAARAMLERAGQVLELTYHHWSLHERPRRRRGQPSKTLEQPTHYRRPYSLKVDIPSAFA